MKKFKTIYFIYDADGGKWVAKTMHFSAASFGEVTVTQASDFED